MKTLWISFKITAAFSVLLFVGYVLVLWGFAAIVTPNRGEAEQIVLNGKVVGAVQVGQRFTQAEYFRGRPSAVDYDGSASGGSNKGPSDKRYLREVEQRTEALLAAHPYLTRQQIPSELVTASGSGLDPHLSPSAVAVQIRRVAEARGLSEDAVKRIVTEQTRRPWIGQPYINVLELNVALDHLSASGNKTGSGE